MCCAEPAAEAEVEVEPRSRRNSGTFTNPHPALLRAASPRSELATAGKYTHTQYTCTRNKRAQNTGSLN